MNVLKKNLTNVYKRVFPATTNVYRRLLDLRQWLMCTSDRPVRCAYWAWLSSTV